jgi:hypothetical protein
MASIRRGSAPPKKVNGTEAVHYKRFIFFAAQKNKAPLRAQTTIQELFSVAYSGNVNRIPRRSIYSKY